MKHDVEDDGLMECVDQFGVELPTGMFFGLSAQTGDLSGWFKVKNRGLRTTRTQFLTLSAPCLSENCIKIIKLNIFTLLCLQGLH